MHFDEQALFSDDQAITVSAASTNYINLGTVAQAPRGTGAKRDIGGGVNMPLRVQVTEAFAGLTSLQVVVEVDSDSAFGSAKEVAASPVVLAADLAAGYVFPVPIVPPGTDEQYLRLRYVVAGTATDGTITAGIVAGHQTNG